MEPIYVDNLTTAYEALFKIYSETLGNDENFKSSPYDAETNRYREATTLASHMAASLFRTLGLGYVDYLHIWVNEKGQLTLSFPQDVTDKEKLIEYCRIAERLLAICAVTQQAAKEQRG